jgi:hypothetical protein
MSVVLNSFWRVEASTEDWQASRSQTNGNSVRERPESGASTRTTWVARQISTVAAEEAALGAGLTATADRARALQLAFIA